jgi:RimJ/RimL family protein N-acetyltransferase
MLKGKIVYLRLFEPGDYEKTYLWHNDHDLMSTTCGPFRFVSKEIERSWVQSKSENNQKDIYLAICAIENDEMIGWYSISDIDYLNRKCQCSGVVIGDKRYCDGEAFQEVGHLALGYIFNELNMNRVTGSCLREHIMSRAQMEAKYWILEGVERQAVFKLGKYHDICHYSLLREEYLLHLNNGDYNDRLIIRRVAAKIMELKTELNNKDQK